MARWHAASTDKNRAFMLQTLEAMYGFLMVSTGGNAVNREKFRLIKESPEYTAAFKKYSAFVREQHEQKKAMKNARRSGSMNPSVFFTKEEFDTYKRLKQETAEFSWHLQVRCEEEAEKLAATRSAEALKLLMISAVDTEELQDFFTRCYAMAIEEAKRNNTKITDPFGRDCSAREAVTNNPNLLEKEKKRFPGGTFTPGPRVSEGSTPPPTPGRSSTEPAREAQRAESAPEDPSSRGRGVGRPPSTDARPRDPSAENRGPDTLPKPNLRDLHRKQGRLCHQKNSRGSRKLKCLRRSRRRVRRQQSRHQRRHPKHHRQRIWARHRSSHLQQRRRPINGHLAVARLHSQRTSWMAQRSCTHQCTSTEV
eukprot:5974394-Amphidinium_carterae.1